MPLTTTGIRFYSAAYSPIIADITVTTRAKKTRHRVSSRKHSFPVAEPSLNPSTTAKQRTAGCITLLLLAPSAFTSAAGIVQTITYHWKAVLTVRTVEWYLNVKYSSRSSSSNHPNNSCVRATAMDVSMTWHSHRHPLATPAASVRRYTSCMIGRNQLASHHSLFQFDRKHPNDDIYSSAAAQSFCGSVQHRVAILIK